MCLARSGQRFGAEAAFQCGQRNSLKAINVDGEHFIRFRDKSCVFKFIRLNVDVALVQHRQCIYRYLMPNSEACDMHVSKRAFPSKLMAHQIVHSKAEMSHFPLEYFVFQRLVSTIQKLKLSSHWSDTGDGRKLNHTVNSQRQAVQLPGLRFLKMG